MTTPLPVDPRVALTFARRERGTTHWLEIEYPSLAEPTDMLRDLDSVGWKSDGMHVPEFEAHDLSLPFNQRALGYKVKQAFLTGPHGSGIFGEWSADEKRANMAAARRVLRKYGFLRVPVWTKTLADMM